MPEYFLVELEPQVFVVAERHAIYATHLKVVSHPIQGATWASKVLAEFVANKPIACMSDLARYVRKQ